MKKGDYAGAMEDFELFLRNAKPGSDTHEAVKGLEECKQKLAEQKK
jgi:hypothetical protein